MARLHVATTAHDPPHPLLCFVAQAQQDNVADVHEYNDPANNDSRNADFVYAVHEVAPDLGGTLRLPCFVPVEDGQFAVHPERDRGDPAADEESGRRQQSDVNAAKSEISRRLVVRDDLGHLMECGKSRYREGVEDKGNF